MYPSWVSRNVTRFNLQIIERFEYVKNFDIRKPEYSRVLWSEDLYVGKFGCWIICKFENFGAWKLKNARFREFGNPGAVWKFKCEQTWKLENLNIWRLQTIWKTGMFNRSKAWDLKTSPKHCNFKAIDTVQCE